MSNVPPQGPDPSHDYLKTTGGSLEAIFNPKSVALIGATETPNSVGRTVLWNLIKNPFGGVVYPVNLKRSNVLGIKAYPSIKEVPDKVDLAVVVTPAGIVPNVMKECVEAGVKGSVIISAGFKEMGAPGIKLEQEIMQICRPAGLRIIGPNCLGVMNTHHGLNATFAGAMALKGNVAFISQSGALCTAILDWSLQEGVGFSHFVSIGSMLDVNWGDLIDYMGNDPATNSILIYMESIGDARSFLSAAREVALSKPIIVIKAGRTQAAAKAAASHTGSLAGSDDVLDAAFKRVGVLRVNSISDLFNMAEVLSKQPRPQGNRLVIVTNAGGPGVLATDALITSGGTLAELSADTMTALNGLLPAAWSRNNPVDVLGDAPPERYAKSLEIVAKDPGTDGMLVVLTPQDMSDAKGTAEALAPYAKLDKPVLASWMGGPAIKGGDEVLNKVNIPTFAYPDTAAQAFCYMAHYSQSLASLYETPSMTDQADDHAQAAATAEAIISAARKAGRTLLSEHESKEVLAAYGIPTTKSLLANTAQKAVEAANQIGYPVVLKLHSLTLTHKTDVGGVKLNLKDADAVQRAFDEIQKSVTEKAGAEHFAGVNIQPMIKLEGYELILGSSIDNQFGPVLLFGTGGQLVEVFKDRALGLPPLNATLATRLMEQTKIYTALKGVRGRKSVDLKALEHLLVRFSQMVVEQKWMKECDINPLLASPQGLLALDARVVLHPLDVSEDKLPKAAIRPYPTQYVEPFTLKDGTGVTIRPIRPEDEPMMVKFHETLSENTVRQRFFTPLKLSQRVQHDRLVRKCFTDFDRELALVVQYREPKTQSLSILGVGRLSKIPGQPVGEYAVIISDHWHNKGLGTQLLSRLVQFAKDEGLRGVRADILPDNKPMQRVSEKLGFKLQHSQDSSVVAARLDL